MKRRVEPCEDWKEPSQERETANAKALTWNPIGWHSENAWGGGNCSNKGRVKEMKAGQHGGVREHPEAFVWGLFLLFILRYFQSYKEDAKVYKERPYTFCLNSPTNP